MKKILIIFTVVLVAAATGAAGFWGGITYQKNQAGQALERFASQRGAPPAGMGFPGNGQLQAEAMPDAGLRSAGGFGGLTTGEIQSVDGDTIVISTARSSVTVKLTSDTAVEQSTTASLADLQPGLQVLVTGQREDDGILTASQVLVLSGDLQGQTAPPATRTAP